MKLEDVEAANGILVTWESAPNANAEYRLFLRNVTANTFLINTLSVGTASTGAGEFFITQDQANFAEGNRYRIFISKVEGHRAITYGTTDIYFPLDVSWPAPSHNRPVNVTSPFGYRSLFDRDHNGVDLGTPIGTRVYAIADGRVEVIRTVGAGGNTIIINHGNGYTSSYMHLGVHANHDRYETVGNGFRVAVGDIVKAGDLIGLSGNTAGFRTHDANGVRLEPSIPLTSDIHLHFEVRKNGTPINPMEFLHWDDDGANTNTEGALFLHRNGRGANVDNRNPLFVLRNGIFVPNPIFTW
jgi:murein DD-endopeptidase MepM/ murein hydrolase activator NlpD